MVKDEGERCSISRRAQRSVEALLRLGERQGYLTYEMLNERLPDEVMSPGTLDAFLAAIDSRGIRLIDEAAAP